MNTLINHELCTFAAGFRARTMVSCTFASRETYWANDTRFLNTLRFPVLKPESSPAETYRAGPRT